jgi:hypothetical protein
MTAEQRWIAAHRQVCELQPEKAAVNLGITPGEAAEWIESMVTSGVLTPLGSNRYERITEIPPWEL